MQLVIPFPNMGPLPILYKKDAGIIQFLDDPYCPPKKLGIKQNVVYSRQHDDTDGLPLQNLLIKLDQKNNVHVKLEFEYPTNWMTFKSPENGGGKYHTHRAFMVVAAAINLDNKFGRETKKTKSQLRNTFDDSDNWAFPNVYGRKNYEITADSFNDELKMKDMFDVYIACDGDTHVSPVISSCSLRFRNLAGGGRSLRVHHALYLLAEAIYRDNDRIAKRFGMSR